MLNIERLNGLISYIDKNAIPQAQQTLKREYNHLPENYCYCILGAMAEYYSAATGKQLDWEVVHSTKEYNDYGINEDGYDYSLILPNYILGWYGLNQAHQDLLYQFNDDGLLSFQGLTIEKLLQFLGESNESHVEN